MTTDGRPAPLRFQVRPPQAGVSFYRLLAPIVAIAAEEPPRALPARDGVYLKNRFRAKLGLPPF